MLTERPQCTELFVRVQVRCSKDRMKHEQQILLEGHSDACKRLCGEVSGAFRDHHAFLIGHALSLAENFHCRLAVFFPAADQRKHLCVQQCVIGFGLFGLLHVRQPASCDRRTGQLLNAVG